MDRVHTATDHQDLLSIGNALSPEDGRHIGVLLSAELQRLSVESQSFWLFMGSLIGTALLSAGGFLAIDSRDTPAHHVPDWIWGIAGGLPLLIVGYATIQLVRSVMRSHYARAIERTIYWLHSEQFDSLEQQGIVPTPATELVSSAVESTRHGLGEVKILQFLELLAITFVAGWGGYVAINRIANPELTVLFASGYLVTIMAIMSLALKGAFTSHRMWRRVWGRVTEQLGIEYSIPPRETRGQRRLISYLILPRPDDFIVKAIGLHLSATLVGWWAVTSSYSLGQVLYIGGVVLLCFGFLIYQSRYMLNDWKGRTSDARHAFARDRRRVPDLGSIGQSQHLSGDFPTAIRTWLFWMTFAIRIILGLVLPWILLDGMARAFVLIAASIGVFLLAAVYEWLRCRPPKNQLPRFLSLEVGGVFAAVGVSYGLRAAMGLWFGSRGAINGALLLLASATFYLYGLAIVLMAWVLEGLTYVKRPLGAELREPPETYKHFMLTADLYLRRFSGSLSQKAHIRWLLTEAHILSRSARALGHDVKPDESLARFRGLATVHYLTSWNLCIAAAATLSAILGYIVARGMPFGVDGWVPFVGFSGAVAAGLAIVRPGLAAVVVPISGACIAVALGRVGDHRSVVAVVPTVAVLAVYSSLRAMTYEQTISLDFQTIEWARSASRFGRHVVTELVR